MWLVSVIYRFRYYFAWAVSESALIFSGFCFNGWTDAADAKPGSSAKPGGGSAEASLPMQSTAHCYSPDTFLTVTATMFTLHVEFFLS